MTDVSRAEALVKCEAFLKADYDFRKQMDTTVLLLRFLFPNASVVNPAWQGHNIDGIHMVGSRAEGAMIPSMIKTGRPAVEMDVMVEVLLAKNKSDVDKLVTFNKDTPGYVFLSSDAMSDLLPEMTRSKIEKYISEGLVSDPARDGYVSTEWVKELTALAMDVSGDQELTKKLISEMPQAFKAEWKTELHGAAVNWTWSLMGMDDELLLEISIDAVVIVHVHNVWPEQAAEWPARKRYWPSDDVVQEAMKKGWQIVPKPWKKDVAFPGSNEFAWRQTFTRAEVVVCQARSPRQMLVYMIAKAIFYAHIHVEMDEYVFSAYPLKTSFLWMLEETPPNDWNEECPFTLVRRLFAKLLRYLEEGMLPYYFIPSINILNEEPTALLKEGEKRVRMVADNPLKYLPFEDINDVIQKVENLIKNTQVAMERIVPLARNLFESQIRKKYEEPEVD